ncbi:MAG: 4-hydroxy-tetrahydrodipicolinate synthase [Prevotellaceae bacterium]|jgi:4-hydroxy-tetrahydrodipicolinate synthase|nr:4-hydroxy-tetrahydrodipicolinate synthase [Prevotellaceae bacterium]
MLNHQFTGMGVALITPFTRDGAVSFDALERLVERHITSQTDYLVLCGTTAETPTLSETERQTIVSFVTDRVAGRLPVVLGIGGNDTRHVVESLPAAGLSAISAILSVAPYYNKPSQEGLYRHYKAIAEATSLPIILYNIPGRTGVTIAASTVVRLAEDFENIVAVKEASGNLAQINEILQHAPESFQVISGDDALTLPMLALGAVGVISVLGNAFPREFRQMVHLALQGDFSAARAIHRRFSPLMHQLTVDGNPAGIKGTLSEMGLIENSLRLPLLPASLQTMANIRQILETLR